MTAPEGGEPQNDPGNEPQPNERPDGGSITQEQLNKLLAAQKRDIESRYQGFDDLKAKAEQFDQLEAANQTEAQRLQAERDAALQRATEHEARATAAEQAALRQRIAIEEGLHPKFASRLSGETEDELRADAKETFGEFITTPSFDHGPRNQSAPQSMNDLIFGAAKRR